MLTANRPVDWSPYCGAGPTPGEIWWRWNFDPILLIGLAAAAVLLVPLSRAQPKQRKYLAAAFALLLTLFVSPFCALTSALFSARVAHHVLLTATIAPLLILSFGTRLRIPGSLSLWTALQAVTFWLWHAPPLYSAALSNHAVYWTMQFTLLGTALGFWAALRRANAPAAIAALLATMIQMGLLGALITFAPAPLYAPHLTTTVAWGLGALEDQQLAGLIMWAPAAAIYLAAALIMAHRWLADESRLATR